MLDLERATRLFVGETIAAYTEPEAAVGWLVLGGPRPFTIGESFPRELHLALVAVAESPARALILAGTTRVFCAGADLRLAGRLAEPDFGRRWLHAQHEAVATLVEFELPTVAAVHAAAAGAGCNIALACDHVVAAREARFSQAFVRIGLATDMGSFHLLPRRVGVSAARELMLSGREVEGEEALRLGLADEIVGSDEVWERAAAVATARAAGPAVAYRAIKQGLDSTIGLSLRESLDLEADLQIDLLGGEEFAEGSRAFLEKRAPTFDRS